MNGSGPVLLIPAAGRGSRIGSGKNKLYLFLAGKPVLFYTLRAFLDLDLFDRVLVVVAPGEENAFRKWVLVPFFDGDERIAVAPGGEKRQESVYKGLQVLEQENVRDDAIVCIHDGARPLVSTALITAVYNEALLGGAAVAAVALKDTIKEVDDKYGIVRTPRRERFVSVQTPQCLRFALLREAHRRAREEGFSGSDDAVLVERMGVKVKVVPGSYENIKLTTPEDFIIAETFLYSRERGEVVKEENGEDGYELPGGCRFKHGL